MMIIGLEHFSPHTFAWKALNEAREVTKLPEDLTAKLDRRHELAAEEPVSPGDGPSEAQMIAQGLSPDHAVQRADEQAAALKRYERARKANHDAVWQIEGEISAAAERRSVELIESYIQPAMSALIEQARPHAEILARFAPDNSHRPATPGIWNPVPQRVKLADFAGFDGERLLYETNSKEHKAFQATVPIQREFDILVALWLAVVKAHKPRYEVPAVVGGEAIWTHPEKVSDPYVRGLGSESQGNWPVSLRVLLLATVASEAGFRLASPRQIQQRHDERVAEIQRQKQPNNSGRASFGPNTGGGSVVEPHEQVRNVMADIGMTPSAPAVKTNGPNWPNRG